MAKVEVTNVTPPEVATTPEEVDLSQLSTQPLEVVPTEKLATKKPRKPKPAKVVTKLAAVTEGASGSETTPTAQEAQLPLEFWAGLMQTQNVIMAQRKSERYNSFRIT